jgi:DNA-binding NarL/FixJ family response regulator
LSAAGWRVVRIAGEDALARAAGEAEIAGRLVLIADSTGKMPDLRVLAGRSRPRIVAIGTRRAFATLAEVVSSQVAGAVLDADQPFADLIASLDRLLRRAPAADVLGLVADLRAREEEAQRFVQLSRREQEVLAWLLSGSSAAEIAAAEQVSMATVRSHLRAVLTKLDVSSQLAAVALTHRSCREPALIERIREIHQF